MSSIGRQVARYRKAAKLSGEELAEKAGVGLTRSVIANLENGRKDDVTVTQLMALANALHVPPALLVADVFDPGAESPYPLPEYSAPSYDVKAKQFSEVPGMQRNAELIEWFGARSFRTRYPVKNSATKLANDAFAAVIWYLRARSAFRSAVIRYVQEMDESDEIRNEGVVERGVQREARGVLAAIDSMRRAGVEVSEAAEADVYRTLGDLEMTYDPDFDSVIEIPDFDG